MAARIENRGVMAGRLGVGEERRGMVEDARDVRLEATDSRIDPDAIPRMVGVLDFVRNRNGVLNAVFDWMDEMLPGAPVPFDDTIDKSNVKLVMEAAFEIHRMSEQFNLLSKCMSSLSKEAERRSQSVQLRAGFACLPDELLSIILAYASRCQCEVKDISTRVQRCNSSDAFKDKILFLRATSLSHVCRRFRTILLSTPELWSNIRDDMDPGAVEVSLQRSGGMPLDVSLFSFCGIHSHSPFYDERFLPAVIESSCRWKNLTITVDPLGVVEGRPQGLDALNVPLLTTLSIRLPLQFLVERNDEGSRIPRCDRWNAPHLQSLNIFQLVPRPFNCAPSLKHLHIELGDPSNFGRGWILDMDLLDQFLRSLSSVVTIYLQIAGPQSIIAPRHSSAFYLPKVETVTFSFPSCKSSVIKFLLADIRFPTASTLNLSFALGMNKGHTLTTRMKYVFSNPTVFPKVTKLKLILSCRDGNRGFLGQRASIPFALLGCIRDFTVAFSNFEFQPLVDDVRIPPLRSLTFEKCPTISRSYICDVLQRLDNQGDIGSLEKLTIDGWGGGPDVEFNFRPIPCEGILTFVKDSLEPYSNHYYCPKGQTLWTYG